MKGKSWAMMLFIVMGVVSIAAGIWVMPVILPYHVCSAMLCYVFFLICVGCNVFIGLEKNVSVAWPLAFCEVGLCFALVTLITGSLWGYHAWGAAWVWEPRLTGMFLMTLFFLSWRLACVVLGNTLVSNKKLTASLIVLGLPAMFFTHVAVRMFGGIHPASVVESEVVLQKMWPIVLVVAGEILLGSGLVLLRGHQIKKAGRMAQEAP